MSTAAAHANSWSATYNIHVTPAQLDLGALSSPGDAKPTRYIFTTYYNKTYYNILCNNTLTMFTTAFGIWYLCAAADRHNDPVTLRETTSALAVLPPITRTPRRRRAHYRRRP